VPVEKLHRALPSELGGLRIVRLPQRSFGSHGEAEGWVLADILWHTREGMTAHYSMAQVSLASIIAQRRAARIPSEVPAERKTA